VRGWIRHVVCAAGVLAGGAAACGQGGPQGAPVVVEAARTETVEQWREVTGELLAVRRALLAAEEDGLVVEVVPDQGDSVKAGDVVARMRDTRARLEVARLQAEAGVKLAAVKEREADVEKAQRDVSRMEELNQRTSGALSETEDRRTLLNITLARLDMAKAERDSADAALDWARERLARMTITAPFAARVVAKRTEVGQWLKQGDPVVELVALDQLDVRLDVPEKYVDRLAGSKQPVQVRIVATGQVMRAPVAAIIPDADPMSRLFPVRVRLDNKDMALRPGMSVVGLVPTGGREPTVTIHKDAVMRNDVGEYVLYDAGGKSMSAPITTLFPVGERVAIKAPTLPPGAKVIVAGNERLGPGMPIVATERGAVPAGH